MSYLGFLWADALVTLGLIPKAVLEALDLQDREAAKRTILCWSVSIGSISLAAFLTVFVNCVG